MAKITSFEDIPIGFEIGPKEMVLDDEYLSERAHLIQWEADSLIEKDRIVPPGATINQHAVMKFMALPDMQVSIWAKSEHEFLKPIPIGTKVIIRGKVVEKYVKRNRNYMVTECVTVDENGEIFMKSRETAVYVE